MSIWSSIFGRNASTKEPAKSCQHVWEYLNHAQVFDPNWGAWHTQLSRRCVTCTEMENVTWKGAWSCDSLNRATKSSMVAAAPVLVKRDCPAEEITRDPIFLLQRREVRFRTMPVGCRPDEESGWPVDVTNGVSMTLKDALECDEVTAWWTEVGAHAVWFTRAEAEQYGKNHDYNFKHGWRVYCVCAAGELAEILKLHTKERA